MQAHRKHQSECEKGSQQGDFTDLKTRICQVRAEIEVFTCYRCRVDVRAAREERKHCPGQVDGVAPGYKHIRAKMELAVSACAQFI